MKAPRKIVVSKDGYKTASKSVTRTDFIEETRRMAATVSITLQEDGAAEPTQAAPSTEAVTEEPPSEVKAEAEPPASEVKAEAEPPAPAPPAAVEPVPAPSETTAADAP
ncbi:MAG: hypothetical protein JRF48_03335 [Deltaproteobacteria bacterium]|nr:hypothetical protein [Deltaproteobacteria bacterium]